MMGKASRVRVELSYERQMRENNVGEKAKNQRYIIIKNNRMSKWETSE